MSILWDRRVIIIQRLKSGLIHKGVSRADQRDAEEYRTRNVKSRSQRCQSWWEHLDVLRGELDQSLCNRDGLRRWSDLSHISRPSFMLLLPVFIYLPELTHRCPFSRFFAVFVVLLRLLSEYQWSSLTMYYKQQRTVIKGGTSNPHPFPLPPSFFLSFFAGDCSLLDNIWKAWRMANNVPQNKVRCEHSR